MGKSWPKIDGRIALMVLCWPGFGWSAPYSVGAATLLATAPLATPIDRHSSFSASDDNAANTQTAASALPNLGCHGPLARNVWQLWADAGLPFARQIMQKRLMDDGDTYVLYDVQTLFHNLHSLAVRCRQVDRQRELADLVSLAYTQLVPDAPSSPLRQWVCRGGAVCNSANRLVNTEVMLVSVQFLALATDVANHLQASPSASEADQLFAAQTARIALEHLLRWATPAALNALQASHRATLGDVVDGSSRYFLTDKVLWQLTVYAHVGAMLLRDGKLQARMQLLPAQWLQLKAHAQALAALVHKRTVHTAAGSEGAYNTARAMAAGTSDLDAGFWRHYKDNRYAAYEGNTSPAVCERDADGRLRAVVQVPVQEVPVLPDIGWDLSHARRLVHFLQAVEQHGQALQQVWQVPASSMLDAPTRRGFSTQLLLHVWNQDAQRPLFANYWSGANGWYRVAYDNGTGRCMSGYAPFGLTDSFATGGFITWARWQPRLQTLGLRLYALTQSTLLEDREFVERHYRGLSAKAAPNVQMVQQLMFWPSLIANL